MSGFAIRTPYLIIVSCLIILVLGLSSIARMPVDMFPSMNVPVVIVATFYSGMPPEQVEGNITYHLERFFTLASGIDHGALPGAPFGLPLPLIVIGEDGGSSNVASSAR